MAMQKQRYVSLAWLPTKANVVVRVYKHMSTDILAAGRKIQIKYISPFSCSPPSLFFPGSPKLLGMIATREREREEWNRLLYNHVCAWMGEDQTVLLLLLRLTECCMWTNVEIMRLEKKEEDVWLFLVLHFLHFISQCQFFWPAADKHLGWNRAVQPASKQQALFKGTKMISDILAWLLPTAKKWVLSLCCSYQSVRSKERKWKLPHKKIEGPATGERNRGRIGMPNFFPLSVCLSVCLCVRMCVYLIYDLCWNVYVHSMILDRIVYSDQVVLFIFGRINIRERSLVCAHRNLSFETRSSKKIEIENGAKTRLLALGTFWKEGGKKIKP